MLRLVGLSKSRRRKYRISRAVLNWFRQSFGRQFEIVINCVRLSLTQEMGHQLFDNEKNRPVNIRLCFVSVTDMLTLNVVENSGE